MDFATKLDYSLWSAAFSWSRLPLSARVLLGFSYGMVTALTDADARIECGAGARVGCMVRNDG
jgi:hypothetical protein